MQNSKVAADPLDRIDELILETMRRSQDADSIKERQINETNRNQNFRRNNEKRVKITHEQAKNEEILKKLALKGWVTQPTENYRPMVFIPNNWNGYQRKKSIAIINNEKNCLVILSSGKTYGLNAKELCLNFLKTHSDKVLNPRITECNNTTYCSLEYFYSYYNKNSKIEYINDGQYYTVIHSVGDYYKAKEIIRSFKR